MLHRILVGMLLVVMLISVVPTLTQNTCSLAIEAALKEADQNCNIQTMDRNTACYGYKRVDTNFNQVMPDNFFTQPADLADVAELQSIHTAAFDAAQQEWGVALLHILASNIPNTLPGQGLTFLLLGDTEVQNAVPADQSFQPVEAVDMTILAGSNIRSAPRPNANVVGSLAEDAALPVDARSADEQWLRVLFSQRPAWVNRSRVVNNGANLGSLPVVGEDTYTPMQAFYVRTLGPNLSCTEAPNALVIQGPDNLVVDFNANGAVIHLGANSTVVLNTPTEDQMQLTMLSGSAAVDGMTVNAGFTVYTQLTNNGQKVKAHWSGQRPVTASELDILQPLETISELLPDSIELPSEAEIQEVIDLYSPTDVPTPVIVVPGVENPIATSQPSSSNGLTASFIANPSSGFAPLVVLFASTSTGSINSYDWNFGDGGSASSFNPGHTYSNPGTYTVTLTITGANGSATSSSTISVLSPATQPPPPGVAENNIYNTPMNTTLFVAAPGVLGNDTPNGGSAVLVQGAANGSVSLNGDGSFTYTPNPGAVGWDTFHYQVTNASGTSNTAIVSINVS